MCRLFQIPDTCPARARYLTRYEVAICPNVIQCFNVSHHVSPISPPPVTLGGESGGGRVRRFLERSDQHFKGPSRPCHSLPTIHLSLCALLLVLVHAFCMQYENHVDSSGKVLQFFLENLTLPHHVLWLMSSSFDMFGPPLVREMLHASAKTLAGQTADLGNMASYYTKPQLRNLGQSFKATMLLGWSAAADKLPASSTAKTPKTCMTTQLYDAGRRARMEGKAWTRCGPEFVPVFLRQSSSTRTRRSLVDDCGLMGTA